MRATLIAIVMGAALASPATALAANCAPPGTSGVVEYLETIPGASCNAPFPAGGSHGGRGSGGGLTPGTTRALQAQGNVGLAVERLVAATGTAGQLAGKGGGAGLARGDRGAAARTGAAAAGGQSLPSALLGPVSTGNSADGSGLLVPIFIATALLLAAGMIVARRRQDRRSR